MNALVILYLVLKYMCIPPHTLTPSHTHTLDDAVVRARLSEALEAILNRAQEPPKSKKPQHSNSKNAVLFEAINLILHFQG